MSAGFVPAAVEAKPLSEPERLIDTFIAPSKTFTDIRRNASWWVPWLVMAIVGWIWVFQIGSKIGFEKVVENQLQLSPKQEAKMDQLTPEQRATQMAVSVKFTRAIAYGYPAVTILIAAFFAVVLLATFNFGFGQKLSFMQCMAISMYAFLPGLIKVLLSMLAIAVGGGEGFTFQNPVASNLGGLVDTSSAALHSLATSLDVFVIWTLVLTGIGYSCVTGLKRGTCLKVVFGWWIVAILVGAAFSALFA